MLLIPTCEDITRPSWCARCAEVVSVARDRFKLIGFACRIRERLVLTLKLVEYLVDGKAWRPVRTRLLPELAQFGDAVLLELTLVGPVAEGVADDLARRGVLPGFRRLAAPGRPSPEAARWISFRRMAWRASLWWYDFLLPLKYTARQLRTGFGGLQRQAVLAGRCFISMIKYAFEEVLMAGIERLTVTLPTDMAALVRGAVDEGDYASSSEVIREALREWKMKRELQSRRVAALKSDIDRGLADVAAGRIVEFNAERIIERGRKLLKRN
jgi:antitoxin ParD1/3/4